MFKFLARFFGFDKQEEPVAPYKIEAPVVDSILTKTETVTKAPKSGAAKKPKKPAAKKTGTKTPKSNRVKEPVASQPIVATPVEKKKAGRPKKKSAE